MRQRKKNVIQGEASPMVRAITRVSTMLRTAHAQDFERRRKSGVPHSMEHDDEDDDDTDDDENVVATIDRDERDGSLGRRAEAQEDKGKFSNAKGNEEDEGEDEDEDEDGNDDDEDSAGPSSASEEQDIAKVKVLGRG
jgi:hypothetical protein